MLREWPFLLFLSATGVSILGDRMAELAIPFLVLARTGSAFGAGLIGAAQQLPVVLLAFWVGAALDRRAPLRVMVASDLARAAVFAAVAALVIWGPPLLWPMAILMFLVGVADVWFRVASGAFLPRLLARERLIAANGYVEGADAAMTLTGPALAGVVLQAFGVAAAVFADAASFLASGLLLALIGPAVPPPPPTPAAEPAPRTRAEYLAGLRILATVPQLRIMQVSLLALNAETSAVVLLLVALTRDRLRLSGFSIGLVLAGAGVGGLLSSTLVVPRLARRRWGPVLAVVLVTMSAALAALAFSNGTALAFAANAVLDGAAATGFVVAGTVRQSLVADTVLGRVTAASLLVNTLVRAGSVAAAGALISWLGERASLGAFAALLAAAGMLVLASASARMPLARLSPLAIERPHDAPS